MIKEYFLDLFTEGLGDICFMKYYKYVDKNIKNSKLKKVLISIYAAFYLIFLMLVAIVIFKLSFPL